ISLRSIEHLEPLKSKRVPISRPMPARALSTSAMSVFETTSKDGIGESLSCAGSRATPLKGSWGSLNERLSGAHSGLDGGTRPRGWSPGLSARPPCCSFGGLGMRSFDFAPLYRSTVGFDRLASLLDATGRLEEPGYPPYNIEKTGDDA